MPDWLKTYLNWWGSQAEKFMEMTFFDFLVSLPLAFAPLIILFWLLGGFKKSKKQTGFDNPNRSSLAKSIDER